MLLVMTQFEMESVAPPATNTPPPKIFCPFIPAPPVFPAARPSLIVTSRITELPTLTLKTRLELLPLILRTCAPGPLMVMLWLTVNWLASVIEPVTPKLMVSPSFASERRSRNVPEPASATFVTVSTLAEKELRQADATNAPARNRDKKSFRVVLIDISISGLLWAQSYWARWPSIGTNS